jgi:hypothetical protein
MLQMLFQKWKLTGGISVTLTFFGIREHIRSFLMRDIGGLIIFIHISKMDKEVVK